MRFVRTPLLASFVVLAPLVLGPGCASDRLAFVTKTNVGLNVTTLPQPTAELNIARSEGIIAPTYEDGQTLPVAASFLREGGWFDQRISSVFTGGDAALAIAQPTFESGYNSILCLRHDPTKRKRGIFATIGAWFSSDDPQTGTLLFGTDTTIGLRVKWTGAAAIFPDNVKLGYNRTEIALAPITGRKIAEGDKAGCAGKGQSLHTDRLFHVTSVPGDFATKSYEGASGPGNATGSEANDKEESLSNEQLKVVAKAKLSEDNRPFVYELGAPSFLAILENESYLTSLFNSKVGHVQLFATGEAATYFVRRQRVKDALLRDIAPAYRKSPLTLALITEIVLAFDTLDKTAQDAIVKAAVKQSLIKYKATASDQDKRDDFEKQLRGKESFDDDATTEKLIELLRKVRKAPVDTAAAPAVPPAPAPGSGNPPADSGT